MSTAHQPDPAGHAAALAELREMFRLGETEIPAAAKAGREALDRLAKVAFLSGGSQAGLIQSFLASLYNGDCAPRVQLDFVGRLDWTIRKDVAAVLLGIYHGQFADTAIREAAETVGGIAAVETLHWHTAGGPVRQALQTLAEAYKKRKDADLLAMLRALEDSTVMVKIGVVRYMDRDLVTAYLTVLAGISDGFREEVGEWARETFERAGIAHEVFGAVLKS